MTDRLWVLNSIMLGVGLAMDAFSVSLANGLHEPGMSRRRMAAVAGTFGGFQTLMPLIGWFLVHELLEIFRAAEPYIPWVAFILLLLIGGNMIREGIRGGGDEAAAAVSFGALMLQGVATSIDALSVGFTIEGYRFGHALEAGLLIAAVTYVLCFFGLRIGQRFGTRLSRKATILGGVILIGIGVEIFITGIFGA